MNDPHIETWKFRRMEDSSIKITSSFFGGAAILLLLYPSLLTGFLFLALFTIWAVVIYFFRDPDRNVVKEPDVIVGPCDGVVVEIVEVEEEKYLSAPSIRISIFLSVFDVHVQRAPIGGAVSIVDHQPGQFLQAFRPEASEVNEYIAMVIDNDHGKVLVKQIAGILARRCVNYAVAGQEIGVGQRFGLIKFGSRIDLFIPENAQVKISIGDRVVGGVTPLATFEGASGDV